MRVIATHQHQNLLCSCAQALVLGLVLDADAVHTVALVCRCGEALALEHMTQVAAAVGACDLDAPAVAIDASTNASITQTGCCYPVNVYAEQLCSMWKHHVRRSTGETKLQALTLEEVLHCWATAGRPQSKHLNTAT
jgi:hypothetical protein